MTKQKNTERRVEVKFRPEQGPGRYVVTLTISSDRGAILDTKTKTSGGLVLPEPVTRENFADSYMNVAEHFLTTGLLEDGESISLELK